MYAGYSLLAVIPARGGSKGLPNKNIANCSGKPLITWTIEAAKKTGCIDEVFVSTDSESIAEISRQVGGAVPFLRPSNLALDDSSLLDVVQHAWETFLNHAGIPFDYILVLQPTSPLRNAEHIMAAIKTYFQLRKTDKDTLASVYEVSQKNGWLMSLDSKTGYVNFCMDISSRNPQRQKLAKYFLPNGAIFIIKGSEIQKGLYSDKTIPYIMTVSDSIDIDLAEDLKLASKNLDEKFI
jgi:CMP-N,N'-diacetyllegionaminic acid synthase